MSAVPSAAPFGPGARVASAPSRIAPLRQLISEVDRLGVRFRLRGAEVAIDGAERLPDRLKAQLLDYDANGWLWAYLGGEAADAPSLALLARLGVTAVLVETRRQARDAIRQIERDKRIYGDAVGLDIETTLKPGLGALRPAVRLNIDGSVAETQGTTRGDRAGVDPHQADIAIAQIYAGGSAFIFTGVALDCLIRSHWLRRQHLAIHNAVFETLFISSIAPLYRLPPGRSPLPSRTECTQQAANLLLGVNYDIGRSLANTVRIFLKLNLPKELQLTDWGAPCLSDGQKAYAALDAIFARKLWPLLEAELKRKDRYAAYLLQRKAIPGVAAMQKRGMRLDLEKHKQWVETSTGALAEARRGYQEMMGRPPPTSDNDVREWLRLVLDERRLDQWPRTDKKGELSVATVDIKYLMDVPSMPLVLEIMRRQRLLNNFGHNLANKISPVTGRIHCSFILGGTKAGRFSSRDPNLQQLPAKRAPEFKSCICANEGCLLIACDWSMIELRALAWLSRDTALTQAFRDGRDLHKATAASINRIPEEEVSAVQRSVAKIVNFATVHGGGPRTLVAQIFLDLGVLLSEAEAEAMQKAFFGQFPQAYQWRLDNHERCRRQGYVRIGCGRTVEARWEKSRKLSFTQHCDLPIQGIAADCMLRAIPLVHSRLKQARINGGLVSTIHDELVVEAAAADAEAARSILEQSMLDAFVATFRGAPTTGVATAKIGKTWAEAKG